MNFINKIIALTCFFYSALSFGGKHHHVIVNGGTVHLKGALVSPACVVSISNLTIDMGNLRSNQFSGVGSYAPETPFSIKLSECDSTINQKVSVAFFGNIDKKETEILKINDEIDSAKGVGISLFDKNGNVLIINKENEKSQYLHDGENIIYITARYRSTQTNVIGGKANSFAWFTLTYN
ncbi:fimbrial protein [Providencia rettgeri]